MTIIIEQKMRVRGEYRLVLNEGTPREKATEWFPNIITNQGLDYMGNLGPGREGGPIARCCIGTGTATPAFTDTALQAVSAHVGTGGSGVTIVSDGNNGSGDNYSSSGVKQYPFTQGDVVGNMTEIGIGIRTSNHGGAVSGSPDGSQLFSRALIVDGAGNPTSLSVTSIDQLTVYYKITMYPDLGDYSGSFALAGVGTIGWTARMCNVAGLTSVMSDLENIGGSDGTPFFIPNGNPTWQAFPSTLGAVTGTPSSAGNISGGSSSRAWGGAGTNYTTITYNLATGDVNFGAGIGGLYCNHSPRSVNAIQIVFDTAIPKDNTKTFSFTFRRSWSR